MACRNSCHVISPDLSRSISLNNMLRFLMKVSVLIVSLAAQLTHLEHKGLRYRRFGGEERKSKLKALLCHFVAQM
eukprot:1168082-Amphidinium_carterae.1